jgi:hypothetical protein
MSLTFKRLQPGDHTVTEFRTSRTTDIDFDREVGADEIDVMDGIRKRPPFLAEQFETPSELNPNGTYKKMVYDLVNHLYYDEGTDYDRFGIENQQDIILDHLEGSQGRITVIKVSPRAYGETLAPGTVRFDFPTGGPASNPTGGVVQDDGDGNLFAENGILVGNVFYAQGVIVFTRRVATAGQGGDIFTFFPSYAQFEAEGGDVDFGGFRRFRLRFGNRVTHFENEVKCEVLAHEFTWTENRSVFGSDEELVDYAAQDDFRPYITTVGLYDDQNNLVVVGKLDRPLRKPESIPLTIAIKFDT